MPQCVVKVENLGKKFVISHLSKNINDTLRDFLVQKIKNLFCNLIYFRRSKKGNPKKENFWVLRDINFEIFQGERIGVIGKNGAGKSTLLKLLSRITEPTEGIIKINGRIASLLEVGTGFHPELSGRENIYLNGAILGMTKKEIQEKFNDIVEFSGVEKFLDTPVKRYSSGMFVRLAFAVAAHLEPEILVVDEVLAVGDAAFQKKCLGKMEEISKTSGRTVFFVSHNMNAITALCQKVMVLDQGKVAFFGDPLKAVDIYLGKGTMEKDTLLEWVNENKKAPFSEFVNIQRYYILDEFGEVPGNQLFTSKNYKIVIETEIFQEHPNLAFFISYYSDDDTLLFISDIHDAGPQNKEKLGVGKKKLITELPVHFFSNKSYQVELSCVIHYQGWPLIPGHDQRLRFHVVRNVHANEMGYNEANHPFTGDKKPGLMSPTISWEVEKL